MRIDLDAGTAAEQRRRFTARLPLAEVDAYQLLRSRVATDPTDPRKRARLRRFVRARARDLPAPERVSWNAGSAWRNDFLIAIERGGATVAQAMRRIQPRSGQFEAAVKVPAFRRRYEAALSRERAAT